MVISCTVADGAFVALKYVRVCYRSGPKKRGRNMTKRLLLMRHGEAQNAEAGQSDKQRLLSRKGQNDMKRLHDILRAEGLMPSYALASEARRTQMTLMEVTGDRYEGEIEFTPALYNAFPEKIIETAQLLNDAHDSALIVAHNPGIFQAILDLVNPAGLQELQGHLSMNFPAGTLVIFNCPIESWRDLRPQANTLFRVFVPE